MSNLLSQASLVMIPSGYKEDIVYSPVPTNGNGDLSFTRASNGTRVNSAGLVEVCPWNLNTNSDDFATGWSGANRALTADATTAPNGTTTADQLGATGGTAYYAKYITSPVGAHTFSVFLKYGNRQYQQIYGYAGTAYFAEATFDLQNGTVYSIQHGNASIENVGGGWYRCSIYGTSTGVTIEVGIENIAVSTYTYAWGAQLNIGLTAKPYFPTTDRLNVPRLTYQNGGGGCPSLLLEKQSTNLFYPSDDFSGGSQNYITYTANTTDTLDPSGQNNADKFVVTTSGGDAFNRIGRTIAIQNFSLSVYVKGTAGQKFQLFLARDSYAEVIDTDVLTTGDWQRVVVSGTFSTTSSSVVLGFEFGYTSDDSVANQIYYLWGAQLEESSYATSYIPTTSSSATRVADECYKTGISSLIGQTEGTIFAILTAQQAGTSSSWWNLGDNSGLANWIFLGKDSTKWRAYIRTGGSVHFDNQATSIVDNTPTKIALAYKSGDNALYINGVQVATNVATFTFSANMGILTTGYTGVPTVTESMQTSELVLFPTRLTNSELAQLTA